MLIPFSYSKSSLQAILLWETIFTTFLGMLDKFQGDENDVVDSPIYSFFFLLVPWMTAW